MKKIKRSKYKQKPTGLAAATNPNHTPVRIQLHKMLSRVFRARARFLINLRARRVKKPTRRGRIVADVLLLSGEPSGAVVERSYKILLIIIIIRKRVLRTRRSLIEITKNNTI